MCCHECEVGYFVAVVFGIALMVFIVLSATKYIEKRDENRGSLMETVTSTSYMVGK